MARRYIGWTTTRFGRRGVKNVRRYRRYGNKTYLIGKYTRVTPSKKYDTKNWRYHGILGRIRSRFV